MPSGREEAIIHICYVINSLDGGGAALPLPKILGVLRDAGMQVSLVVLREGDGRARESVQAAGFDDTLIGGRSRRYLSVGWRLNEIVRESRPDLIWTSLNHATLLGSAIGALNGIPVVAWVHSTWLKPVNLFLLRRMRGLVCHRVADSENAFSFARDVLGISPEQMTVWPPFIASRDSLVAAPAVEGIFRLGSLGALHRKKGYDVLVRAMALLAARNPDAAARLNVVIAGEGPEATALEGLARELGVQNFTLAGFTNEPRRFLEGLHGYIQPSHHEGLCIAAHEAMEAGLPVIASPVGEMQYSIRRAGGGMLVPYGDVEELARAMEAMVADPVAAAQIGARSRAYVLQQFSPAHFRERGAETLRAALRHTGWPNTMA